MFSTLHCEHYHQKGASLSLPDNVFCISKSQKHISYYPPAQWYIDNEIRSIELFWISLYFTCSLFHIFTSNILWQRAAFTTRHNHIVHRVWYIYLPWQTSSEEKTTYVNIKNELCVSTNWILMRGSVVVTFNPILLIIYNIL